jgi:hypothetical protein
VRKPDGYRDVVRVAPDRNGNRPRQRKQVGRRPVVVGCA